VGRRTTRHRSVGLATEDILIRMDAAVVNDSDFLADLEQVAGWCWLWVADLRFCSVVGVDGRTSRRFARLAVGADGDGDRLILGCLQHVFVFGVDAGQMRAGGGQDAGAKQHPCGADPERRVHVDLLAQHTG
jgi:hypothetical protein